MHKSDYLYPKLSLSILILYVLYFNYLIVVDVFIHLNRILSIKKNLEQNILAHAKGYVFIFLFHLFVSIEKRWKKKSQINNIDNILFLSWFNQDISNVLFG